VYPVKEVCLWPEAFHQIFQFCREIIPVTWATIIATSSLQVFIGGKKFSKQNYETLKILAASRMTWRKFNTVCLLIIGTTAGNLIFGKKLTFSHGVSLNSLGYRSYHVNQIFLPCFLIVGNTNFRLNLSLICIAPEQLIIIISFNIMRLISAV